MVRKFIFPLFLVFSLLATICTWKPALSQSNVYQLKTGETIELGRMGLSVSGIPQGVTQVSLEKAGNKLPGQLLHKTRMKTISASLIVRFLDKKSNVVNQISAPIFVYFSLRQSEEALWLKNGMNGIAIWYVNQESGRWGMCSTSYINGSSEKKTPGRLACRTTGSGTYLLGQGDFTAIQKKFITASSAPAAPTASSTVLNVRAYIDGKSQLIIRGDTIYWHHLDWAAPGRHFDAKVNQPTYLNNAKWEPTWPDIPDSENRDCQCDSSPYQGIPTLANMNQEAWVEIVKARGTVVILQQPSTKNDFTLIIEFDDNIQSGPDWYEVNVGYTVAKNP